MELVKCYTCDDGINLEKDVYFANDKSFCNLNCRYVYLENHISHAPYINVNKTKHIKKESRNSLWNLSYMPFYYLHIILCCVSKRT